MINLAFKLELVELMRVYKVTCEKLAEAIDVTPETISRWRTGKDNITAENRSKFLDFFKSLPNYYQ